MEASQSQNQDQIAAETAKVNENNAKLDTIATEVAALKAAHAAGQNLDWSGLDAALADSGAKTDADVAAAAPDQPAPPAPGA